MSGTTPTGGPDEERPDDPYATPRDPLPPADQPPAYGSTAPPAGAAGWPSDQPAASPYGQPGPVEPPKSILTAVRLMYVGAVLSALSGLSALVSRDAIRDALDEANETASTRLTEDQLEATTNLTIGIAVAVALIGVALWLWMAASNKKGKSWARVVATVLGGLNIVFTLISLATGTSAGLTLVSNLVSIALAAVILFQLYRPESSQYYAAQSRRL